MGIEQKRVFIGKRVLLPRRLYLILHPSSQKGRNTFATFDDPTSGKDDDTALRTLLAFTDEDKCGEYITEELRNIGEPYRVEINQKELGRLFRMMIGGKIYWFTFDRMPGNRIQDQYTCWFISLKLFSEMCGKYVEVVSHANKPIWTPGDIVMELPDKAKKIIEDSNGK